MTMLWKGLLLLVFKRHVLTPALYTLYKIHNTSSSVLKRLPVLISWIHVFYC